MSAADDLARHVRAFDRMLAAGDALARAADGVQPCTNDEAADVQDAEAIDRAVKEWRDAREALDRL